MPTEPKIAYLTGFGCGSTLTGKANQALQYRRRCELERLEAEGFTHVAPLGLLTTTPIRAAIARCNRAGAIAYEYDLQKEQEARDRREVQAIVHHPYTDGRWLVEQAGALSPDEEEESNEKG